MNWETSSEATIADLDQAIQSKSIILNPNSIRVEQLMDDSAFLSGLVDVQVMDEDLTTCKCVSLGKHVVGTKVSCLLDDSKGDRAECSDLVKSRPKRSEIKMKKGLATLQGPPVLNSGCATITKPTSKATVSCVAEEKGKGNIHQLDGLKKGCVAEEKGNGNCRVTICGPSLSYMESWSNKLNTMNL